MNHASTSTPLSVPQRALVALLALLLFALSVWAVYSFFTSRVQISVWDFHTPWLGLRAMLRDGANPYSDEVTLAIQKQRYGRPAHPDEDQLAFAYPLHIMAVVGPLAILPLPVAYAFWFSLLGASLVICFIVGPWATGWRPITWLLALTAFFTFGLYPNVWAVILGQVSIVVAAFIALAWWGLRTERWQLAGICLALATIKPQVTFLIVPTMLIWSLYQRRWRVIITFFAALGVLVILPLPWLPDWPLEWLAAVSRYAGYTVWDPPLVLLTGSTWLSGVVAVLLLVWTVYSWWQTQEIPAVTFGWAPSMVVVVSMLIAPRTSQANQLVLLLPLFFVFTRLSSTWVIAAVEIGLLVGLWLVDFALLPPTSSALHMVWQHQLISPVLPVGLVLVLLFFSPVLARERSNVA